VQSFVLLAISQCVTGLTSWPVPISKQMHAGALGVRSTGCAARELSRNCKREYATCNHLMFSFVLALQNTQPRGTSVRAKVPAVGGKRNTRSDTAANC